MAALVPLVVNMVHGAVSYSPTWPFLQPQHAHCRPFPGHTCLCFELQELLPLQRPQCGLGEMSGAKNNGQLAFSHRAQLRALPMMLSRRQNPSVLGIIFLAV